MIGQGSGFFINEKDDVITNIHVLRDANRAEIKTIKETEMHKMMMQVQEAEENGRNLLNELSVKIESDIQLAKERLESLA